MSTPQQNIPITLTPVPVPVGIVAANIDQLLQVVASYIGATISTSVSFFTQGATTPTGFVTSLFYNTSSNTFYGWNAGSAAYLPITQFAYGDIKYSVNEGDSPTTGWIVCDGRALTAIENISATQLAVLQSLFGIGGNLPDITPLSGLTGLPVNGSFSSITNPAVAPATGTFAGLTVSNPPAQADVQAITANAETLDESTIGVQTALAAALVVAEKMLDSMNGSNNGPQLFALVFCGFA
jgi:hypothetical protein